MSKYYNKVLSKLKNTERYSSRFLCLREYLPGHCFSLLELVEVMISQYDLNIDVNLAKNIAQNHDLGEYLKGDVDAGKVAHKLVSNEEKTLMEEMAWLEIKKELPEQLFNQKYTYWQMFEKLEIKEAKFVRVLDNLEALLHMTNIGFEGFMNKEVDNACGMDEIDYDITAKYADTSMQNFIKHASQESNPGNLKGFMNELKIVKTKLKKIYEQVGAVWKEEYNYTIN
jgi:5'-deoxynucleotidase YfbR-like HD superfamily hydrolase